MRLCEISLKGGRGNQGQRKSMLCYQQPSDEGTLLFENIVKIRAENPGPSKHTSLTVLNSPVVLGGRLVANSSHIFMT